MRSLKFTLVFLILVLCASASFALTSLQEANTVLDKWTSFHWGNDCFVWIVHYSEDLVDPWVRAESEKQGMSPEEEDLYRQTFLDELKITETEAFLFSFYSFGPNDMDMSPFSDKISLRTESGKVSAPLSYDPSFDLPMRGVVQGIVFFPKQEERVFGIIVKGLGIETETSFFFPMDDRLILPEKNQKGRIPRHPVTQTEVIVVPSMASVDAEPPLKNEPVSEDIIPAEKSEVLTTAPEVVPDSSDHLSKDEVLSTFIARWVEGDYAAMYDLLSGESKGKYSKTAFTASVMQSPFRLVLQNGYEVHWIDEFQAEVVARTDLMIMKTFKRKIFRMVETGDAWRISW